MTMNCALCGGTMARNRGSLPPGRAMCHGCRAWVRSLPKPPRGPAKPDGSLACAVCRREMHSGSTSLPQGKAICLGCRRWLHTLAKPPSRPRECATCGSSFQPNGAQKYCAPKCRPRKFDTRDRPSATERGYGQEHRKLRKRWAKRVAAGGVRCWRCDYPINPGDQWDLGHDDHDRTIWRGAECIPCNRGTAANRRRRVLGTKVCDQCGLTYSARYEEQRYCSKPCRRFGQRRQPKVKASKVYFPTCWCGAQFTAKARTTKNCPDHRDMTTIMRIRYRQQVGIPLDAPLYSRAG